MKYLGVHFCVSRDNISIQNIQNLKEFSVYKIPVKYLSLYSLPYLFIFPLFPYYNNTVRVRMYIGTFLPVLTNTFINPL